MSNNIVWHDFGSTACRLHLCDMALLRQRNLTGSLACYAIIKGIMSDIKDDIIKVALEKMRCVGIRSLSIDDICKLLGISKKTFYVHFATKEDLVDALLRYQEAEISAKVEHAIATQSMEETLGTCLTIVSRMKQIMQPPAFVYDLNKYYPQKFEEYKQRLLMNSRSFIAQFLQKGIDEGFFRDDLDVSLTANFIARLHLGLLSILSGTDAQKEQELAKVSRYGFSLIVRGVVTPEGGQRIKTLSAEIEAAQMEKED